ncbi:MAG: HEAT repeat domain-containing protein [Nitrososphaeraceae archaeon]
MKNPKNNFIDNEPEYVISGSAKRASRKADLERFPAIKRRQMVASRLMNNSCGNEPSPTSRFVQEDLPILMQIAQEAGPYTNPLLRKQAIRSLRQFKEIQVMELLLRICSSLVEHESIRGQALISLAHVSKTVTSNLIQSLLLDEHESIREYVVTALREIGDEDSLLTLRNLLKKEKSKNIKSQIEEAILSVESLVGIQVTKPKVRRPILKAKSPKVDRH